MKRNLGGVGVRTRSFFSSPDPVEVLPTKPVAGSVKRGVFPDPEIRVLGVRQGRRVISTGDAMLDSQFLQSLSGRPAFSPIKRLDRLTQGGDGLRPLHAFE